MFPKTDNYFNIMYDLFHDKQCKLVANSLGCGRPIVIVCFVFHIILTLPYLYVAAKIMRLVNFSLHTKRNHALVYCLGKVFAVVAYIFRTFTFSFDIHLQTEDTFVNSIFLPEIFHQICMLCFFISLTSILVSFSVPGGRTMYFISNIVYYLILALIAVCYILSFVNLPKNLEFELFSLNGRLFKAFDIIFDILFCFGIFIISQCAIFSNIRNYFTADMRKGLIISLFFLCFGDFTYAVLNRALTSFYFRLELKYDVNHAVVVFSLLSLILKHCDEFPILAIIYLFSKPLTEEVKLSDDGTPEQMMEFITFY